MGKKPELTQLSAAEQEIARAQALVQSSRQERILTAQAYGLPLQDLAEPVETAPVGWHEEADRQGLCKMFKDGR